MVKMKKIVALLLVSVMMFSLLAGCSNNSEEDNTAETNVTEPNQQDNEAIDETDEQVDSDAWVAVDPITPDELGLGDVKWVEEASDDGFMLVTNEGGATLSYSTDSGVKLIQVDGYAFKDLNKNDMLDQYEDWREPVEARIHNLAELLPIEDIAGLMLHSSHQFSVSEELSEDQIAFLDGGGRAFLSAAGGAPIEVGVKWNNTLQAYTEGRSFGIPVSTSSDPRTSGISSVWPTELALAATFDPSVAREAGEILSIEHRMLGVDTFLKPLTSITTDPRWYRMTRTYGEDPALNRDMVNGMVNGIQSTYDESGNDLGWGKYSMNGMVKRWPGDGSAEGGRGSHAKSGNTTVYPGDAFETHLIPYVDGAFNLDGKTGYATAVMLSYSVSAEDEEQVGTSFSTYKVKDLLRTRYEYEGVACTDWYAARPSGLPGMNMSYGVEDLTVAERVYKGILAGTDQFGGLDDSSMVMEAYEMGVDDYGEEVMDARFRQTAVRVLRNIFTLGLFENAYIEVDKAMKIVGTDAFRAAAFEAHLKSVVMLKNSNDAIKAAETDEKPTVYIPMIYNVSESFLGNTTPASWSTVDSITASEYFNVVTDTVAEILTGPEDDNGNATVSLDDIVRATPEQIAECDYALVIVDGPENAGSYFTGTGYDPTTDTYLPKSLQYGPYKADSEYVRKESIAGQIFEVEKDGVYGTEIVEEKENRSYYGQEARITNASHLDSIQYAVENTPEDMPVIVALRATNPVIVSEFESQVDAIIVSFGVSDKALLEVVAGKYEPSGLLPVQFPINMETVEKQFEDVPRDMECYVDSEGNTYDFAFGMNWSGVINDERVQKYSVPALVEPTNKGN